MSRYQTARNALDYIVKQYDATHKEFKMPHGDRVAKGLKNGATTGVMGGTAAGLLAYGIAKYFGADNATAMQAATYWGVIGGGAGFGGSYIRHAGDRAGMESLKNIVQPAMDYARCFKTSYRFA